MSGGTRPTGAWDAQAEAAGVRRSVLRPFRFCPPPQFVLWLRGSPKSSPGDVMSDPIDQESEKLKKPSWWWPGVVATSLAGAAVAAFRGCWHSKMTWPIGVQGYSYQVCLNCGAMRLFDEKTFSAYGPFRYDLDELIAWQSPQPAVPIDQSTCRQLQCSQPAPVARLRLPPADSGSCTTPPCGAAHSQNSPEPCIPDAFAPA